MTYTLFISFIVIIFIRSIISNFWLFFVLRWLSTNSQKVRLQTNKNEYNFILLIPVLREQKIIIRTIKHFLRLNYNKKNLKIFFISTEKEFEKSGKNEENTIDIIKKLQQKTNNIHGLNLIELLHYPDQNGKMVDQLNFAFDHILTNNINLNKTFVGIYNADSRPNFNTLNTISQMANKSNCKIYQQSAVFFDNFNELKNNNNFLTEKLLKTNSLLQTRWTLVHEIPRFIMQSYFLNKFNKKLFLSHCVGHGLFIQGNFLQEIRKMPDKTLTEDLFFGYILSLLGKSINPLPIMESAEMPNKFILSLKQKYIWFFGPLEHFAYQKYSKENFRNAASSLLLNWFTFQGIFSAFAWILSGWMLLYIFLYPILSGNYNLIPWSLIVFILYAPFSYFVILSKYKFLNNLCSKKNEISLMEYFWSFVFSLPTAIIHSIPPIFSVLAKIKSKITNVQPQKPKTER